jgi:CheY-like chemotaxis protein
MRRPSVLVVDDDSFARAVVSRRVAMLSDVVEAEDGQDALAQLQAAEFDLAIVDLEMPNVNGRTSSSPFAPTRRSSTFPSSS